jgi:hypothetical protein
MHFYQFVCALESRATPYPLPPDWPVPEPNELLYPVKMTVAEVASEVDIPLATFTWALACWRHHTSLTATRH